MSKTLVTPDDGYRAIQEKYCTKKMTENNETVSYTRCVVTSWAAFVVAGTRSILMALNETLQDENQADTESTCTLREKVVVVTLYNISKHSIAMIQCE